MLTGKTMRNYPSSMDKGMAMMPNTKTPQRTHTSMRTVDLFIIYSVLSNFLLRIIPRNNLFVHRFVKYYF